MRVIPAIDILAGKCVRLSQGDYTRQKIYREDPLEVAKEFEAAGIHFLHVVDLDGARSNGIVNYKILEKIAAGTNLQIDFGGGIKSDADVRIAFESGARQITGGSVAVKQPELFQRWLLKYGPQKIILGADCMNRKIATNGWLNTSDMDVVDFVSEYAKKGIQFVVCTDISKDGMLAGTSNVLYREILDRVDIRLIASGGVSAVNDLILLQQLGCDGVIVGKALYEGKISLKELEKFST